MNLLLAFLSGFSLCFARLKVRNGVSTAAEFAGLESATPLLGLYWPL